MSIYLHDAQKLLAEALVKHKQFKTEAEALMQIKSDQTEGLIPVNFMLQFEKAYVDGMLNTVKYNKTERKYLVTWLTGLSRVEEIPEDFISEDENMDSILKAKAEREKNET